jgi:hypothetical protein
MSNIQSFISFDGLAANVQVANALIEEYNIELSAAKAQISCIEEEKREAVKSLRSKKLAMRHELQPWIAKLLRQRTDEVKQLEETFNSRKAPFENEIRAIQAKIDAVRSTIAPIRKLPAEILGIIFQEVVRLGVSPWLLATISKSWRRTSFTTPSLWSHLYIGRLGYRYGSPSRWTVDEEPRYVTGNRLLCRNMGELAYFAEKAGTVPLDVLIDLKLTRENSALMQGLLGHPYSSRISSISLSCIETKEEIAGWTIGRFPVLRTLRCSSLHEPFVELILSQTNRLESLITSVELSSALSSHPFWKSLRVLRLGDRTQAADFNHVVSGLTHIEDISGIPHQWPDVATPRVTFQHIKSITLWCHPQYLGRLQFPRLEKLVWSWPSIAVTRAEIFNGGPNWDLSLPNVLWFEGYGKPETFEWVLKYLPKVQIIALEPSGAGLQQDAWALGLLKSLANAEDMLCPRVRRLSLGCSTSRIATSKALVDPLIIRFIESRVELGIPLEYFKVWWVGRFGRTVQMTQYI